MLGLRIPSVLQAARSKTRVRQAALRRRTVEKKLVHADPREPPRDGLLGGVPGRAEREVRHDGRRLEEDRETHANVAGTGPHLEHVRVRPRAMLLKGQHGAQRRRERDQADGDAHSSKVTKVHGRAVTSLGGGALAM